MFFFFQLDDLHKVFAGDAFDLPIKHNKKDFSDTLTYNHKSSPPDANLHHMILSVKDTVISVIILQVVPSQEHTLFQDHCEVRQCLLYQPAPMSWQRGRTDSDCCYSTRAALPSPLQKTNRG